MPTPLRLAVIVTAVVLAGGIWATRVISASNADTTAPDATITNVVASQQMRGTYSVEIDAVDDRGMRRVDLFVDTTHIASSTTEPYAIEVDFTRFEPGRATLSAKATDEAGNHRYSVPIEIVVEDTDAPLVTIEADLDDDTLTLTATATDNVGVAQVDFFVGGDYVGSAASAPWSITVDRPRGRVEVQAKALDAAGNHRYASVTIVAGTRSVGSALPSVDDGLDEDPVLPVAPLDPTGHVVPPGIDPPA